MIKKPPMALKTTETYSIKQGNLFTLNVASRFLSKNAPLRFRLVNNSPSWLSINERSGLIRGKTPAVYTAKTYKVTVEAINQLGKAHWVFYITVTRIDFQPKIDAIIDRYNKAKEMQELNEDLALRELLEYYYEYFNQSDEYRKDFFDLIEKEAKERGIAISENMSYDDFFKVINEVNPDIRAHLIEQLPKDSILLSLPINTEQLRNLFRQGSQQLGVHPLPIWNYLAAPNRQNWSQMETVMAEATIGLERLYEIQEHQDIKNSLFDRPTPYIG